MANKQEASNKKSKYQKFETETVHRSVLKGAPTTHGKSPPSRNASWQRA